MSAKVAVMVEITATLAANTVTMTTAIKTAIGEIEIGIGIATATAATIETTGRVTGVEETGTATFPMTVSTTG